MLFFKDIFTSKELEDKTRKLYESYKSSYNSFNYVFEDIFNIKSSIMFPGMSNKEILMRMLGEYYKNEYFIKNMFLNNILFKRKTAISGLELPILESRADIVSINGHSIAYEIKTEYDTFQRLEGQLKDYLTCFEYVYVICPKVNLDKIKKVIPDCCGIYIYSNRYNANFVKVKEASYSPLLSKKKILDAMLLSELDIYYKTRDKEKIVRENDLEKISFNFKLSLKDKYHDKWEIYKTNYKIKDFE